MKVLIDANVAITYISGRSDPFSAEIEKIMRLCAEEKIEGVIALFHTYQKPDGTADNRLCRLYFR